MRPPMREPVLVKNAARFRFKEGTVSVTASTAPAFMPLFRSWFETARIADTLGAAGVAASDDNLLAELDLGPMVEAEARLLKHAPSSATEAACLLEIVRQNIADSGRSDSLDARALEAVQIWLADFAVGAGQGGGGQPTAAAAALISAAQALGHHQEGVALVAVADGAEGRQQFRYARLSQNQIVALGGVQFAQQGRAGRFQHGGDLQQTRGRDAVHAALVLLDLLEGHACAGRQLGLGDAEFFAAGADAGADRDVNGVYCVAHNNLRNDIRGRQARNPPCRQAKALH